MSNNQSNWFTQNWKWFVPTVCLVVIAFFTLFVYAMYWGITSLIKTSTPYAYAMQLASDKAEVKEALGYSLKAGFLMQGNIEINNDSGNAHLSIPIEGARGKGTIYVVGKKEAGQWHYSTLEVEIKNQKKRINLL